MNDAYGREYERMVQSAKDKKVNLNRDEDFQDFADSLGLDAAQAELFEARHQMKKKLGANEQFLGNGLTNDKSANNPATPLGEARVGCGYGAVETFTYDKNPQTLGKLEKLGILERIPLNKA